MRKLAKGEPLDEKYHDHQLLGKLKDFRDCHIRPDHRIKEDILELYVYRIGSHSKIYKKQTSIFLLPSGQYMHPTFQAKNRCIYQPQ
ncbi:MAG TPA: hypothetical protein DCZ76_14060 [Treponema sp.]|nr:hypothetical protein [Treponema sp.]